MVHMKYLFKERLLRYILVGSGVAAFQFLSFALLLSVVGLHYQLSTFISFVATVVVSYLSQRKFTYATDDGVRKNALAVSITLFLLSIAAGFLLISSVMHVGVELLSLNEYVVYFFGLAALAACNFFFFHVVFK
jgi:putative flippase GtrA